MKEIVNKTARPIRVPLPGGKSLHLGPAKNGQVSDQATDLPSFRRLLDAGTIELVGEGAGTVGAPGDHGPSHTSKVGHQPKTHVSPKGDR